MENATVRTFATGSGTSSKNGIAILTTKIYSKANLHKAATPQEIIRFAILLLKCSLSPQCHIITKAALAADTNGTIGQIAPIPTSAAKNGDNIPTASPVAGPLDNTDMTSIRFTSEPVSRVSWRGAVTNCEPTSSAVNTAVRVIHIAWLFFIVD